MFALTALDVPSVKRRIMLWSIVV